VSELSRRSFLYFFTSLVKSAGMLALTFFLTPLLLKLIGANDFGTFKVLAEIYGYMSLLELGLYSSLIACIIPLFKAHDSRELNGLLSRGRLLYVQSALWTVLASLALIPFLPKLTSWANESTVELYVTFLLLTLTAILIPFQPYKIYLEASNQGHKVNLIIFFQNVSFLIISIVFALFGWQLKAQAMGMLISSVVGVILIRHYAQIKIPLQFKRTSEDQRFTEAIRKYQKPQVLNDLATKICLNCDQLIIAIFLGPLVVTKVFLGQRVILILQGQLQAIGQSSYASLGKLYYEDVDRFKKRIMEVTKIVAVAGVAVLVPVCVLNQPFIALWVGEGYQMPSNALTYLASSNAFLYGLFSFWSYIFTVLGKPSEITSMIWKQAMVNLVASIIGTKLFGGIGPILGTLISFLLVPMFYYPRLLEKHFGLSGRGVWKTILTPLVIAVIPLFVYQVGPVKINPQTWPTFILTGAVIFFSYVWILLMLLFNREERDLFFNRIKALWQKLL
jgi:O-antigen/teichoic acid export membrane protein